MPEECTEIVVTTDEWGTLIRAMVYYITWETIVIKSMGDKYPTVIDKHHQQRTKAELLMARLLGRPDEVALMEEAAEAYMIQLVNFIGQQGRES